MSDEQANPQPESPKLGPDSCDAPVFEATGGIVDTTIRPIPEHVRRRLASTPWLFPNGMPAALKQYQPPEEPRKD